MSGSKVIRAKYLIDSVILIDHLNGVKKATKWLARNGESNSVISVTTRAEILCGADRDERYLISALLDRYQCLPIDKKVADMAAEFRQKFKLKLPDAFQAALAKSNKLVLVTRNTKDFNKSMGFVNIPYRI